ncbi:hypothetical protein V8C26DRAFT_236233 [Trichoderma gracile]
MMESQKMQRSTIGIGRAKAVGGKRGPVCRWIDLKPFACQFPPPLQPVQAPASVALTEEAGSELQAHGEYRKQTSSHRGRRVRVCAQRRGRNEARKPQEPRATSQISRARGVAAFPGHQGNREAAAGAGADMITSIWCCCCISWARRDKDADPACR